MPALVRLSLLRCAFRLRRTPLLVCGWRLGACAGLAMLFRALGLTLLLLQLLLLLDLLCLLILSIALLLHLARALFRRLVMPVSLFL